MLKKDVLIACFEYVDAKSKDVEMAITDAENGIREETKSSAGDKYETSREMIQQDLNRYQGQLKNIQMDKLLLSRIQDSRDVNYSVVGLGSLVETSSGVYFISISIGVLKVSGESVFVVSSQSPIGKMLLGKTIGEIFVFQNRENQILDIR